MAAQAQRKEPGDSHGRKYTGNPEDFRLSLVEHLEELRTRILRCLSVLVVGWVIGWFLEPSLYKFLEDLVAREIGAIVDPKLYVNKFDNLTQPFMLKMHLSFLIGLVISIPVIVLQIWGFVAPALKTEEQKPLKRLAPLSLFLFFMGVGFCYLILPATLQFFAGFLKEFNDTALYQTAGTMVFFILKMMLAFGLAFQLPLIVYVMGALELLRAETLLKYWRQATTVIFVISMIVTPSQDPLSMLMMAIPLCVLFVISVYAVKFTQRKKQRARAIASDDGKTYLLPAAQTDSSMNYTAEEEFAEEEETR